MHERDIYRASSGGVSTRSKRKHDALEAPKDAPTAGSAPAPVRGRGRQVKPRPAGRGSSVASSAGRGRGQAVVELSTCSASSSRAPPVEGDEDEPMDEDDDDKDTDKVDRMHRYVRIRRHEKGVFDGEVVLIDSYGKETRGGSSVSLSSTNGLVMIISNDY